MLGLESFAAGYMMLASTQPRPSWCRPEKAPRIRVVPQMTPVKYDFSKNQAQLGGFKIDTVNPYGNTMHTDTGGLMHGTVQLKANTSYRTVQSQGYSCSFYETIEVTVQLGPTIYIASEYPKGGCKNKAVLEHELKHVQIERDIANIYSKYIGQQMVAAVKAYPVFGPVPVDQQRQTHAKMSGLIQNVITQINKSMSAERMKRQQALDNINEYNRVNKLIDSCRD